MIAERKISSDVLKIRLSQKYILSSYAKSFFFFILIISQIFIDTEPGSGPKTGTKLFYNVSGIISHFMLPNF